MSLVLQSVRQAVALAKPYRWAMPVAALLGTLMTVSEGIGIALLLPLVESLSRGSSTAAVPFTGTLLRIFNISQPRNEHLITIVLLAVVFKSLLGWVNAVFVSWVNLSIGHNLRCRMFDELLRVDQRYMDFQGTGRLFNSLATETWRAGQAIGFLFNGITSASTVLVFVGIMLALSWQTTLVVVIAFACTSLLVRIATRRIRHVGDKLVDSNRRLSELMVDLLSGMPVIQSFDIGSHIRKSFVKYSDDVRRGYHRIEELNSLMSPATELCYALVVAGVLVAAAHGATDVGRTIVLLMVLVRVQPQVRQVLYMRGAFVGNAGAIQDVWEVLGPTDKKQYVVPGTVECPPLQSEICFENVAFRYGSDDKYALNNISVRIARNSMVALVGRSGAGKSTMVNLLLRLYDVTAGRILVDGTPLTDLDLSSWRRRIAFVPQDVYVFSETLNNNILVGRLDATKEEVYTAARQSHADEYIPQLSHGVDTKLGENGVRLSGGQSQRLALARALIRDADIVVLDEATSWLDNISERVIRNTIEQLRGTKTLIVITHRLHTIQTADHVIVMENGEIAEQGAPEELLARDGKYARLSDQDSAVVAGT